MKMNRLCRWLLVVLAGGIALETGTSCSSTLTSAIVSSISDSLSTVLESQVDSYISQLLGTTS
jgi:hypothetical protein